jgi:hypothetical protein
MRKIGEEGKRGNLGEETEIGKGRIGREKTSRSRRMTKEGRGGVRG